jgi:multidrug efflux system outer membrane protein
VKITMLSEIATTYVAIRALQQKKAVIEQSIEVQEYLVKASQSRFDAGLASTLELNTFKAALQTDQATLAFIEEGIKTTIYSLAVLIGQQPESFACAFDEPYPIPKSFGKVPAGLPADLLRRRPDIRSAERYLAAATANVGVAVAQLFPVISLTGSSSSFAANPLQGANIGWTSDQLRNLFKSSSRIWGIGAAVSFPLFDFGKREAGIIVQESLAQQAYLTYQKTVITALQEVEQQLAAYFHEERRLKHLEDASAINTTNVNQATDLFSAGLANYDEVVIATQAWLTSWNSKIDAEQALITSLIALYKAMGGEW